MTQTQERRTSITDQEYDTVKQLHAQGLSRNAIARELGRSPSTVTRIAQELRLVFQRGPGAIAGTEARLAQLKERRAALQVKWLEYAERLGEQLFAPVETRMLGGKDRDQVIIVTTPEPSAADKRNLAQAIGVFADRSLRYAAYDKVDGTMSAFDAWLVAMAGDDKP